MNININQFQTTFDKRKGVMIDQHYFFFIFQLLLRMIDYSFVID